MGELKNHINDASNLNNYLRNKGENHNYYKHYSKIDRILNILDKKKIYLKSGENWNDTVDRESFNSDKYDFKRFGMCFSFSKNENVAMWMLYSGIDRRGGMIEFTRKEMNSILDVEKIEVGAFNNENFESYITLNKDQFQIYLTDIIYYYEEEKGKCKIRRHDEVADGVSKDVLQDMNGSKKSDPWKYENECRLIVSIDKKVLNNKKCDTVQIDLENMDLGKPLGKVYKGPCCTSNDQRLSLSQLYGKVEWNLCEYASCRTVNKK